MVDDRTLGPGSYALGWPTYISTYRIPMSVWVNGYLSTGFAAMGSLHTHEYADNTTDLSTDSSAVINQDSFPSWLYGNGLVCRIEAEQANSRLTAAL